MAIGAILGIASAATSIAGGIMGNKAAKKAAKKARRIAEMNARGLERQAVDVHFRERETLRQAHYQAGQARGTLSTYQSAANLNTNFGSAALARLSLDRDIATNAAIIRYNATQASKQLLREAAIVMEGGQVASGNLQGQGIAQLFGGASNAVTTLANTYAPTKRPLGRSGSSYTGVGSLDYDGRPR